MLETFLIVVGIISVSIFLAIITTVLMGMIVGLLRVFYSVNHSADITCHKQTTYNFAYRHVVIKGLLSLQQFYKQFIFGVSGIVDYICDIVLINNVSDIKANEKHQTNNK